MTDAIASGARQRNVGEQGTGAKRSLE